MKIAVIGGDGTGPEVIAEALKALTSVCALHDIELNYDELNYNGTRYINEGKLLTDDECQGLKEYDAVLLGAIGHTDVKPGILEKDILLKMRFDLDQYINLRPIKLYENVDSPLKNVKPEDIDYLVVRENTGGLYTGEGSFSEKNTENEVAVQKMIYTRHQVERCIRFAFEQAVKRNQDKAWKGLSSKEKEEGFIGKVTLCGKTNVLTYVYDLWERVFHEVGKEYPKIKRDYVHVDAVCIYMVDNPARFDVIVTGNMFGDIITDLAAITQGGLGVAPGGNLNPEGVSMFEPIGGTAPDFTGKNEINPVAAIGAAQMLLDHLGYKDAAIALDLAIRDVVLKMQSQAAAKMGYSTTEIGDLVVESLQRHHRAS
ncbi:3-isopropylmalate dehydrogenase [Candidatus Marinamargulisbacteria bacterium SCGC AG-343-D04]|nr:3-isopropylmalate dehydrogenase [Candidatus Marinamargulisbacteria bacterium SCGC AG-343-D04]